MRLESLRLKNFRAFRDARMDNIPRFSVLVGANGTGKSTLFSVFGFLRQAMATNVNVALAMLGGPRGFAEVRSRNATGPIEIVIKFRQGDGAPLVTYCLQLDERDGKAYVAREILSYRRGSHGQPWHFLDFSDGHGVAITNEAATHAQDFDEKSLQREQQMLKANDILAIRGLAQFANFPVVVALGSMIESWYVSDFHIDKARPERELAYAEHLSREGENLSLVLQYLHDSHRPIFDHILRQLSRRIPGLSQVEAKTTEEGRVLLKFRDGAFEEPFLARHVSDGTIRMLAYLVLLNDPAPYPLLCVEEPENQLYHSLLEELAEEFRDYARRGGQVMVSTHSPDFLNAAQTQEVFLLVKKDGYTTIRQASRDNQIQAYMQDGDKMGSLWRQGLLQMNETP